MAGTGPEDLHALCEQFLAACEEALDSIPSYAPALAGAPERTLVSPGVPAFDCCDQLAVHAAAVSEAPPGQTNTHKQGARKQIVTLVAHATRCIPVIDSAGRIPAAADITAAAAQTNADAWALWNHLFSKILAGELFSICNIVIWDGLRAVNPSGGCGGWTLQVRVDLEGYNEVIVV